MRESLTAAQAAWGLALVTLLALFLNTFQLARQPVSLDDYMVAITAINYMESGQLGPTMWNHPDLRNIIVYGFLRAFGTGVLGVKGVSLVLGTLCTPLVALVARRIFRDGRIALVAALIWACDALVIDFSRQGINDIYLAFFPLLGIYLACRYRGTGRERWLVGAGVSFGLGLASKWSGIFPLTVTLALIWTAIAREGEGSPGRRLAGALHAAALLVVLPVLVYLLTFAPWFARGYALAEWPALQKSMFLETSQHVGYHPKQWDDRDNRAWKWFVLPSVFVDPWMNMDSPNGDPDKLPDFDKSVTVALGYANPLVWLLVWPAIFLVLRRGLRERDEGKLYLAGLFLASYLPLAASPRPIWMNTALSVLPYAVMAVAFLACTLAGRCRRPQLALGVYLGLVLLVASPLYLLATGRGTRIPILREHLVEQYLVEFRKSMPGQPGQAGSAGSVKAASPSPQPSPARGEGDGSQPEAPPAQHGN